MQAQCNPTSSRRFKSTLAKLENLGIGYCPYLSSDSFTVIVQKQFLFFAIFVFYVDLLAVFGVSKHDFYFGRLAKSEEALERKSRNPIVNQVQKGWRNSSSNFRYIPYWKRTTTKWYPRWPSSSTWASFWGRGRVIQLSLLRRRSLGSSRNLPPPLHPPIFLPHVRGGGRLRDEPKERLRRRRDSTGPRVGTDQPQVRSCHRHTRQIFSFFFSCSFLFNFFSFSFVFSLFIWSFHIIWCKL